MLVFEVHMRFYAVGEAGAVAFKASFRDCRLLRVLGYLIAVYAVLFAVLITGKGWLDLPGGDRTRSLLALAVLGVGVASIGVVMARTFRPANWVLRTIAKGVLVHLARFGGGGRASPPAVLFLTPEEIEWAGAHDQDRRALCLRLVEGDYRELEDRIAEVGGDDPPVRLLHARQLIVRWGGRAWVLPGMGAAVEALSGAAGGGKKPSPRRREPGE